MVQPGSMRNTMRPLHCVKLAGSIDYENVITSQNVLNRSGAAHSLVQPREAEERRYTRWAMSENVGLNKRVCELAGGIVTEGKLSLIHI